MICLEANVIILKRLHLSNLFLNKRYFLRVKKSSIFMVSKYLFVSPFRFSYPILYSFKITVDCIGHGLEEWCHECWKYFSTEKPGLLLFAQKNEPALILLEEAINTRAATSDMNLICFDISIIASYYLFYLFILVNLKCEIKFDEKNLLTL